MITSQPPKRCFVVSFLQCLVFKSPPWVRSCSFSTWIQTGFRSCWTVADIGWQSVKWTAQSSCWIVRMLVFLQNCPVRLWICSRGVSASCSPQPVLRSNCRRCTHSVALVTAGYSPWLTPLRSPSEVTRNPQSSTRGQWGDILRDACPLCKWFPSQS